MPEDFSQFPDAFQPVVGKVAPNVQGQGGGGGGEDFSQFPDAFPGGGGEALGAGAAVANRTALTTGPIAAGAVLGAPFGPVGMALGAAGGFFAGQLFGNMADRFKPTMNGKRLTARVEELPPELRSAGVAGDVIGGGVGLAGAPLALARAGVRLGPSTAGAIIDRVVASAAKTPGRFVAVEGTSTAGAAVGAAAAEEVAPGSELARFAGEVGGALLTPANIVTTFGMKAADRIKLYAARLTPQGAQTVAGRRLREYVQAAGEDPDALLEIAQELDIPDAKVTFAQLTGSPAAAKFEAELGALNRRFYNDALEASRSTLSAIGKSIALFRGTGTPEGFRQAAELKADAFRMTIAARLQHAEDDAVRAAGEITKDTPAARATISRNARVSIENVVRLTGDIRDELWARVPDDVQVGTSSLLRAHATARSEVLPRTTFNTVLEQSIADIAQARTTIEKAANGGLVDATDVEKAKKLFTVGHLRKLRSQALTLARHAGEAPGADDNLARIYGNIAEGILDDLLEGGPSVSEPLDTARAFDRARNETFKRSFAGEALAHGEFGDRIPPELLLKRALATGEELGSLQLEELEVATRFIPDHAGDFNIAPHEVAAANAQAELMMESQERLVRLAAFAAVDPHTGRVATKRLSDFISKNEAILNRFPHIRDDLQKAVDTEAGRKQYERLVSKATRVADARAAFAKVIKFESTADAIRGAVRSDRPMEALTSMARLARNAGPAAMEGMRGSIWDNAIRAATDATGAIETRNLAMAVTAPLRPGVPSLLTIMEREGLMTAPEVGQINEFLQRAQAVQQAVATPSSGEAILGKTDVAVDFLLRWLGARAGTQLERTAGGGGDAGSGLIAAQRGSMAARSLFDRMPAMRSQEVLRRALSGEPLDPDGPRFSLLQKILQESATMPMQLAQMQRLHAWMIQSGINDIEAVSYAAPYDESSTADFSNPPMEEEAVGNSPTEQQMRDDIEANPQPADPELPLGEPVETNIPVPEQAPEPEQEAAAEPFVPGPDDSRGLRNNNPGNIKKGQDWNGERADQSDPTFEEFETPEAGIRAIAILMENYAARYGLNTVDGIIRRWSATDQEPYIEFVSEQLNIEPDQEFSVSDPETLARLVGAIIQFENGRQPYASDTIARGVQMAQSRNQQAKR